MWKTIKSVLAAFFGVQRESRRQEDFTTGKASSFIVVGILMGVLFVVILIVIATLAAG
ncbi:MULTISPECIES: DUF2970 domain-containing protein [Halomonas]|jgi:uncharacterized membrane protein|uniref:DUF2970 domain-containing protein n=3 Tax=Halomonas TaxID=2745 RepID=A0AAU7KPC1_9GAMM|nr:MULTISPECIES: DUF2970 domain-containing protein [Halomonas]MBR9770787.1 DUF2970 domain-containing protein [Gammaproteobacteria bacterium]MAR70990.1 DUF2970 domain-containing protein [Halomonas sp.]MBR9879138.1 DUF2970 domain-containing protein [Gammaproteobacteria bacterium]MBY5941390.1 DUF2970 domain-containing protein [Halomonas sp. DP5N14-9]MBY6111953.1 DUF2970 domain-containing protein [Halomonas sp. DP1Y21-3]|tara:strand:- start:24 stop:197 length:174 start_codon:yes stop_codon:yes gene_type:complete